MSFPQGYGEVPHTTSWGGNILRQVETETETETETFHLFVSRMTNNCSLRHWRSNSRIDHAVSPNITGPYTFTDVAVPVWAHNPEILALPDGTFALIHIGAGSGSASGGDICHNDVNYLEYEEDTRRRGRGSNIHISDSLYGPWSPLESSTTGPCNNPSVWVNENRSLSLLCYVSNGLFDLKIADNISGPWLLSTTIDVKHLVTELKTR